VSFESLLVVQRIIKRHEETSGQQEIKQEAIPKLASASASDNIIYLSYGLVQAHESTFNKREEWTRDPDHKGK
jgi:hypothetical protein